MEYFKNQWLNINISVFKQKHRTNNNVEACNKRWAKLIWPNPNIYVFLRRLKRLEHEEYCDILCGKKRPDIYLRKNPSKSTKRCDEIIKEVWATVDNAQLTLDNQAIKPVINSAWITLANRYLSSE